MIDFGSVFGAPLADDQATLAAEAGKAAAEDAQARKGSLFSAESFLRVVGRDSDLMVMVRLGRGMDDALSHDWEEGQARKYALPINGTGARSPLGLDIHVIEGRKR